MSRDKSTAREMAEEVWAASTPTEKVQTVVLFCLFSAGALLGLSLVGLAIYEGVS